MTLTFIRFINIILAALLAGTSFGIWVGLIPEPLWATGLTTTDILTNTRTKYQSDNETTSWTPYLNLNHCDNGLS